MSKTVHRILQQMRAPFARPKLGFVLISTAVFLICFCQNSARSGELPDQLSPPSRDYYFGRTTDRTVVAITMSPDGESINLNIPKSYLTFSPTWRGGLQDTVVVEFVLSTFAPLSESNKSTSDPDAVVVNLISQEKSLNSDRFRKLIDSNIANRWEKVGETENEFVMYISKLDVKRYKNLSSFVDEYFIPLDNITQYPVYFTCLRYTNGPKVGCSGHSLLAAGIMMDYEFRRQRLPEWRKIDESVRNLLDSFVVNHRR